MGTKKTEPKKLTKKQMQCRWTGKDGSGVCTERSRGPRFGFRCAGHPIKGKGIRK
jgi:hypothetical protein